MEGGVGSDVGCKVGYVAPSALGNVPLGRCEVGSVVPRWKSKLRVCCVVGGGEGSSVVSK